MAFKPFIIERMVSGSAEGKIDGGRLIITIVPPKEFAQHEGDKLAAIIFNKLPPGTTLTQVHVVLKESVTTGVTRMCRLVFEIFVNDKPKGNFASQPVSQALYEALITEGN